MLNNEKSIKDFKVGQIVYTVKNSPYGIKVAKYKVIKIFHFMDSILLQGQENSQTKLYKNDLGSILDSQEEKLEYEKIKNNKPFEVKAINTKETFCFNCGIAISKTKKNYCPKCKGSICHNCGRCFCKM
ncbi:MAG: hypothetical protein J6Q51_00600 [Clostridia bacterium]|nr:hypothetical protein [Clostridia bacterium]